jgi:hypothetical protein
LVAPYLKALHRVNRQSSTVFSRGQFAAVPMFSGAQRTPQQRRSVLVPCIIGPFRRSHIFAVMSGMMVISGDVAINGRASASSGESRAYPPWTTRSRASVPDTVPVCSESKTSLRQVPGDCPDGLRVAFAAGKALIETAYVARSCTAAGQADRVRGFDECPFEITIDVGT